MPDRRDFAKSDGPIRSVICYLVWLLAVTMIGVVAVAELIKRRFKAITAGRKAGA